MNNSQPTICDTDLFPVISRLYYMRNDGTNKDVFEKAGIETEFPKTKQWYYAMKARHEFMREKTPKIALHNQFKRMREYKAANPDGPRMKLSLPIEY